MRNSLKYVVLAILAGVLVACGSRARQAELERKVDSLRKAEAVRLLKLQQDASRHGTSFFDTMAVRPLPIRYSADFVAYLPQMSPVPQRLYPLFDVIDVLELKMATLPSVHHHRVMLMAERRDSTDTSLYLLTMGRDLQVTDRLCIYEEQDAEKAETFGKSRLEYFITSDYEITLMRYFQAYDADLPVLEESRRYVISKEGMFEETIIEL